MSLLVELFTTTLRLAHLQPGLDVHLFFVLLGCSAALWGGWLSAPGRARPAWCRPCAGAAAWRFRRWCARTSCGCCGWAGRDWRHWPGAGLYLARVHAHQVVPDRRGMATGMAIMGFGGGAMIGSLPGGQADEAFATLPAWAWCRPFWPWQRSTSVFMMAGALGCRVPQQLEARRLDAACRPQINTMITQHHVHVNRVWGIPAVLAGGMALCMNVSAGIGVIGMASPMLQEVFGGHLIGLDKAFGELDKASSPPSRRLRPALPRCCRCSTLAGALCGPAHPTGWAQDHLCGVLHSGGRLYFSIPASAAAGSQLMPRGRGLHHPEHVRRQFFHRAGLPGRPVRHADGGRHPWPPAHGLGPRPASSARWW